MSGCAVSVDGSRVVSASGDRTLKTWDVATGAQRAELVLPGPLLTAACQPIEPMVVCGDSVGVRHFADIAGVDLGPLVVTAAHRGHGLAVRCPACRDEFTVDDDGLGTETNCPRPTCRRRLRVNPFVLQPLL